MRKIILAAGAAALALTGCSQETKQKAGQTLDSAAADAQADANSAGENIGQAAAAAGSAIDTAADKAGDKLKAGADKAADSVKHTKIEIKHDDDDKTAAD